VPRAEARPVAAGELRQRNAGRHDLDARRDPVALEGVAHRGGRHDHGVERVALAAREAPRHRAHERARHEPDVVEEVLLEKRVIGRDDRHAEPAGERDPGVVGEERRLHVNEVEALAGEEAMGAGERTPPHRAVLGIERHRARRDAHDARIVEVRRGVVRRDERGRVPEAPELGAESLDRGGDAVDARKVDVGDVEDPHPRGSSGFGRAWRARYARNVKFLLQPRVAAIFRNRTVTLAA
jgi:hypothetical protein